MVIPLAHSNSLVFIDRSKWHNYLVGMESTPKVALISAWTQVDILPELTEPLVRKLIKLGCSYFVCAGKYSEYLHDFVDDVILNVPDNDMPLSVSNIMTTWHDADTDDEVAEYFLHLTNVSNGLLVAFLDENRVEDNRLKKAILNLVPT